MFGLQDTGMKQIPLSHPTAPRLGCLFSNLALALVALPHQELPHGQGTTELGLGVGHPPQGWVEAGDPGLWVLWVAGPSWTTANPTGITPQTPAFRPLKTTPMPPYPLVTPPKACTPGQVHPELEASPAPPPVARVDCTPGGGGSPRLSGEPPPFGGPHSSGPSFKQPEAGPTRRRRGGTAPLRSPSPF